MTLIKQTGKTRNRVLRGFSCLFLILFILSFLTSCGKTHTVFNDEIYLEPSAPVSVNLQNVGDYSSYSNLMYGWGLKKNVNAPPEIPEETKVMLKKYGGIYLDTVPKTLYLTFDEGYENGYTAKILDVLKENNVPAAFFVTGPYLEKEKDLVKRMVDEGHIVGNHTVHHPSLPSVSSDDELCKEITSLTEKFKENFGADMKYIRPPRGEYSERTLALSRDLGYVNVFWSFAYKDWEVNNQKGTKYAYEEIKKGVHDGAVLLLHAVSKDNAEVLDSIIKDLKTEGYVFRSLDSFGAK